MRDYTAGTVQLVKLFNIIFNTAMGSSDLYGTGSRILLMIISNNLRVYNTRVRSDCKSKKVILKNSRFLYLVDIIDARALQEKAGKL